MGLTPQGALSMAIPLQMGASQQTRLVVLAVVAPIWLVRHKGLRLLRHKGLCPARPLQAVLAVVSHVTLMMIAPENYSSAALTIICVWIEPLSQQLGRIALRAAGR